MKNFRRSLLIVVAVVACALSCYSVNALAQDSVAIFNATALQIGDGATKQGPFTLVRENDVVPSPFKVIAVQFENDARTYKVRRVKIKRNGKSYTEPEHPGTNSFMLREPGEYEIDVFLFDFTAPDTVVFEDQSGTFTLGAPDDPKPDEPDPKPDDPIVVPEDDPAFPELVRRVFTAAQSLSPAERAKVIAAFESVITRMKSFEIKTVKSAVAELVAAYPISGSTEALYAALQTDAASRGVLSFNETRQYYTAIQKVLRGN